MDENFLLSKFELGTASFGNIYGILNKNRLSSFLEIGNILETFANHGGYSIDTSCGYGKSEAIIADLLKDFKNKKFQVNSKFVLNKDHGIESIKRQVDNSYKIFGNKLHSILCHTPDIFLSNKRDLVYSAFEYIKDNLSINVGLSIYSINEVTSLDLKFKEIISDVQAPFNIFDLTALKLKEKNLNNSNFRVHGRSIFLQGLLLSDKILYKRFRNQFILFHNLCEKSKLSKKEVCIKFALQNNLIDFLVVGINSIDHLNDLISILKEIKVKDTKEIKSLENDNNDKDFIDPRKWKSINE